jgi:type II secretory pathway predicted ATPase ExeA/outer membrane protein OmpA-like peptidoglycan-associated protein
MFESYYELNDNPFRLSADESFRFAHKNYLKAWSYLSYALEQGEGFVMITGQPGSGKTTLIRDILSQLDASKTLAINLVTNQLQAEELLRKVALEFGLPAESYNKATLLTHIEEFVDKQYKNGRRAIIVIDEAQNLTLTGLEELRLLSNLQTGSHPLFQIFLVGQDELRSVILSPEMEQIRQRLIASCQMEPMTVSQTEGYIDHRLGIVGWHGDPEFEQSIFPQIHYITSGIPRKINHVASRLLLYGALEEKHKFTEEDVWIVAEELFDEERLALKSGETFDSFKAGYSEHDNREESCYQEVDELIQGEPLSQSELGVSDVTEGRRVTTESKLADTESNEVTLEHEISIEHEVEEETQQKSIVSDEQDNYLVEEAKQLYPESKTYLGKDEAVILTQQIVNDNRSVADDLAVEAQGDAYLRNEPDNEHDDTVRQWSLGPANEQSISMETEDILNSPTMRAERRKQEIGAMGGLIVSDDVLEKDELFTGGLIGSLRNIALFVVAGLVFVSIFFVKPGQLEEIWGEMSSVFQTMLTSKPAESPVSDENNPISTENNTQAEDGSVSEVDDEQIDKIPENQTNRTEPVEAVIDWASKEGDEAKQAGVMESAEFVAKDEDTSKMEDGDVVKEAGEDYIATQSKYQQVVTNEPDLLVENLGIAERKFQVFFESNNTEVPEQFNEMLNDLYIVLSLNEQANLKISGYADPSGNPLNNMRHSLERAQTVSRYFTERGITQNRIQIEGHSPSSSSSSTAQGALEKHLGSRRVELLLRD